MPESEGSSTPEGSPRKPGFRFLGLLLFVAAFAAGVLLVDRRGARVLAPDPRRAADVDSSVSEIPPSTLSVRILHDLDTAVDRLEQQIPQTFGDLDERRGHPSNRRLSYAVVAEREPLSVELREDSVHVDVVLHYEGRVWFDSPLGGELSASCGRSGESGTRPRAVLHIASPLEIGTDWRLRSAIRVEVEPVSGEERDRCRVSLPRLQLDATEPLLAAAELQLRERSEELDSMISRIDLESLVEPFWQRLQQPFPIWDGAWLVLEPRSVRRGGFEAQGPGGRTLSVRLAVTGRPRIVAGRRPSGSERPLPSLDAGPVAEGFSAVLDTYVDYSTASALAGNALRGREFLVGGRSLQVVDVKVSGLGDGRMVVQLEVQGAVQGRLHLVGTPVLDRSSDQITVPDLGFSVETRNLLLQTAAWLLRGTFPERVRQHARWSLEEPLRRVRSLAAEGMNQSLTPGIRLEGDVASIEVDEVRATREALRVRSRLEGTATLVVGSPEAGPAP